MVLPELTWFQKPIETSAEPGLDSVDPRLLELTDLGARRDYPAAAEKAAELVDEGIFDIRALSYLLYQSAFDGGFAGLADLFKAVENLIGPSFHVIGPVKKREEHFDKRLAWIFDTLSETLAYAEAKQSPEWQLWRAEGSLEQAERAVENAEALIGKISDGPFPNAMRSLGSWRNWLRTQQEALHAAASAPPSDESAGDERAADVGTEAEPQPVESEPKKAEQHTVPNRIELTVSPHFVELCSRLEAFETLIERREFLKAAYLADEIQQTLDDFDPRLYFPDVFARYSELLAQNIEIVAEYWEQKDSPGWKALGQFCQVNLKGFVES